MFPCNWREIKYFCSTVVEIIVCSFACNILYGAVKEAMLHCHYIVINKAGVLYCHYSMWQARFNISCKGPLSKRNMLETLDFVFRILAVHQPFIFHFVLFYISICICTVVKTNISHNIYSILIYIHKGYWTNRGKDSITYLLANIQ